MEANNSLSAAEYDRLVNQSLATLERTYYAHYGLLSTGLLAFGTNLLILGMALKYKVHRSGPYILIAELAIADWITGVAYTVTGLKRIIRYHLSIPEIASQVFCSCEMFFAYFGQAASITAALMMAIERTFATLFPTHYKIHRQFIYRGASFICWTWAVLDSGFMFYGISSNKLIPNCNLVSSVSEIFYKFQSYHKISQVSLISLLYSVMVVALWRQIMVAGKHSSQNMARVKKETGYKIARMLVAVGMMYLVTQIFMRGGLAVLQKLAPRARANYAPFIRMFMILNSGVNLFFYVGLCKEYRVNFTRMLRINKVHPTVAGTQMATLDPSRMEKKNKILRRQNEEGSYANPIPFI